MFIPLFGPERELRDPPGPAELVEEVILTMIERSGGSTSTTATSPPSWPSSWSRIASGL